MMDFAAEKLRSRTGAFLFSAPRYLYAAALACYTEKGVLWRGGSCGTIKTRGCERMKEDKDPCT